MELIIGGSFQGKYEWAKSHYDEKNIWNNFHLYIKEKMKQGISIQEIKKEIDNKIVSTPNLIIISDEIGCGIIPSIKEEIDYREQTGRLLCEIAKKAEKVYRMTFGVLQRIK